jgi:preprotein translocase subunit SecG
MDFFDDKSEPDVLPLEQQKKKRGRPRKNVVLQPQQPDQEAKPSQRAIDDESFARVVKSAVEGVVSILPQSRFERRMLSEGEINSVTIPARLCVAQTSDETLQRVMRWLPVAFLGLGLATVVISRVKKNEKGADPDIWESRNRKNDDSAQTRAENQ